MKDEWDFWEKVKQDRIRVKKDQVEEIIWEAEYIHLKDDLHKRYRGVREELLESLK